MSWTATVPTKSAIWQCWREIGLRWGHLLPCDAPERKTNLLSAPSCSHLFQSQSDAETGIFVLWAWALHFLFPKSFSQDFFNLSILKSTWSPCKSLAWKVSVTEEKSLSPSPCSCRKAGIFGTCVCWKLLLSPQEQNWQLGSFLLLLAESVTFIWIAVFEVLYPFFFFVKKKRGRNYNLNKRL